MPLESQFGRHLPTQCETGIYEEVRDIVPTPDPCCVHANPSKHSLSEGEHFWNWLSCCPAVLSFEQHHIGGNGTQENPNNFNLTNTKKNNNKKKRLLDCFVLNHTFGYHPSDSVVPLVIQSNNLFVSQAKRTGLWKMGYNTQESAKPSTFPPHLHNSRFTKIPDQSFACLLNTNKREKQDGWKECCKNKRRGRLLEQQSHWATWLTMWEEQSIVIIDWRFGIGWMGSHPFASICQHSVVKLSGRTIFPSDSPELGPLHLPTFSGWNHTTDEWWHWEISQRQATTLSHETQFAVLFTRLVVASSPSQLSSLLDPMMRSIISSV